MVDWNAPAVGTVNKYLLDVSTKQDFSSFVNGYNALNVGSVITFNVRAYNATLHISPRKADKPRLQGRVLIQIQCRLPLGCL